MKEVKFKIDGIWKTHMIMQQCLSKPGRAIDLDEMRRRCNVLEKLEKAKDSPSVLLEDAEFELVKQALNTNPWGVAEPELLQVVDQIFASKAPEATVHDILSNKVGT